MTFTNGDVNAHGGCNSISGPYKITGDRFKVTQMASTAMGCEAPLMQQDEWLVDVLEDARIALAGDTLTLDNGKIRMTLLDREVASPDKPLVETMWGFDSIVEGDAVSSVPAGVTASMRIMDGQLELDAAAMRRRAGRGLGRHPRVRPADVDEAAAGPCRCSASSKRRRRS